MMSDADVERRESDDCRASKRQKTSHDAAPHAPDALLPAVATTADGALTESHSEALSAVPSPSQPQLLDVPRPVLSHIFSFTGHVSCFTYFPTGPANLYEELPNLALTCSTWNEIASEFRNELRAITTTIKLVSGDKSDLDAIYEDLEARDTKLLELELHMGRPQSRGMFKLKKKLRPLSKLDALSVDWDRIFRACPSLLRLSLVHMPLDTVHVGKILQAASSHCRELEALLFPIGELNPDDESEMILRTANSLYSALEKWYTGGSKGGLRQLLVAKHHNVEDDDLQARSDEFIGAVAAFCPKIEYLDGWKATYSDANGLSCDEMWFCSLEAWKLFCKSCVHIREFNWFTAPFDDDFLREFAKYPKLNLKKMTIAAGGDGVYHPAFSDGSYHRVGGFQFSIQSVISILAACPALEELHVLLEGFRSQSKHFKKSLNDEFLKAVADRCPKLKKLVINEVIGTHFEKPLPRVTDLGLLSISKMPQLEHIALMQTLTTTEGILQLVDNAKCPRRIILKVGSASAEPHLEYFSVLCELMEVFVARSAKSFLDRPFELELDMHEERKTISKQEPLKAKLSELLGQMREKHPGIAVYFCEWREKLERVSDDLNKLESIVFISPATAQVSEGPDFETQWL
ncbi:hypothetical protein Gpo141_00002514 [Globisporangium polare]